MYADVVTNDDAVDLKNEEQFLTILKQYKAYKSGVTDNTNEG